MQFEGRSLAGGSAHGACLVLDQPLSFWGGLDHTTGEIIDRRHPQSGTRVTGSVLVMPFGRGSSSSSSVLAEALRVGTGPAAVVLAEPDEIVLIGSLVAAELYDIHCPVMVVASQAYEALVTGMTVTITEAGITIESGGEEENS